MAALSDEVPGGGGFHCWPQGAGPSTRSVWPILEAFSRGREAEGHVAPEQLPDGTVRDRDADSKLKGENWVTHSLR